MKALIKENGALKPRKPTRQEFGGGYQRSYENK